jgi:hypothetical protein
LVGSDYNSILCLEWFAAGYFIGSSNGEARGKVPFQKSEVTFYLPGHVIKFLRHLCWEIFAAQ